MHDEYTLHEDVIQVVWLDFNHLEVAAAGATLSESDMSEDDFFKWLTRKGLSEKDSKFMKGMQDSTACWSLTHI